jgi:hypothetical protein
MDLDEIERIAKGAPSGKWEVWTSCSWRRVFADQGRGSGVRVIEPVTQRHDNHPDLMFGPGVAAWLEGVTPDVVLALIAEVRALRAKLETPIAMNIKWSPIESTMFNGWSPVVANDALSRGKEVTVYYGEARPYTARGAK